MGEHLFIVDGLYELNCAPRRSSAPAISALF